MAECGVRIVAAARSWVGTPYRHQASVRGAGTDCLGLVRGVWREMNGAEPELPPPYTPDWGETQGTELLLEGATRHLVRAADEERLGDVLLFRMRAGGLAKHLGIISGLGAIAAFIHAYERHGVVESPLSTPWRNRIAARLRFPD